MNYTSKDIKTLEGLEAIRLRPGMFVGDTGENGFHHLLTENISNSIDEVLSGYGDEIEIIINTKTNTASIKDHGRGIPFGPMANGKEAIVELCTNLHSGGKFGQGGYSVSGGLHGIGLSAVNALSKDFSIISNRDGKQCTLNCEKGILVKPIELVETGEKNTGSTVIYTPDPEIFTKVKWNKDLVVNKIRLLSYLTTNVKFVLRYDDEVMEFFSLDGIKDLVKEKVKDAQPLCSISYFKDEINDILVEVAFTYLNNQSEKIFAFTNNIPNDEGGTHVTGFKSSFTSLLNIKGREYGLLKEEEKNMEGVLVRKGLVAAISIKMKEQPQFTNQTKDKLQSPNARAAVSQAVSNMVITKMDLEVIINKALMEKRAEDAAQRKRDAEKKVSSGGKNINLLKELPANFVDSINKKDNELFLVEGLSAAGSGKMARDRHTQAIYPLRGKPLNTFDKTLEDIIKNLEFKNLIALLGCGIGDKFNIRNLRYERIIIMADADVDGGHINCLLVAFFLIHMPQLLKAKRIFYAVPPLFKVEKGGKKEYATTIEALDNYKGWEVTRLKGLGEMSPEELWESTMCPGSQRIPLEVENIDELRDLYQIIMGKSSKERRAFILKHANNYNLSEDSDYDVEE